MPIDIAKQSLSKTIAEILALPDQLPEEQIHKLLARPPEAAMGDYALPCFTFAKATRKSPQIIASTLAEALNSSGNPWVKQAEAVGAFCNIFVQTAQLANQLVPSILNGANFRVAGEHKKERVMVEFSQPNTHKEFHIGHGRNVCLGDTICRIMSYVGDEVIPVNYIGDEGTHVAKCLWQIKESGEALPTSHKAEWYGKKYAQASQILAEASAEEKAKHQEKISRILANLEAKQGDDYELWQKSKQDCMDDFYKTYAWLDAHFDHYFYESEVSEASQTIVDEFLAKGLFVKSDGAVGIPMDEWNLGFFLARKSDGTTLYITKDLALARKKFEDFKPDRSIYVVGYEQNFHFKQLFKALELMGFPQAAQCHHLSYAHVRLVEGKMSSRKGDVVSFAELVRLMEAEIAQYLEKYQGQWSAEKMAETSHRLAVGAIKYGMLSTDPSRDITFDPVAWTSFEGNSGPYLMYAYSRTQSILKKCEDEGFKLSLNSLGRLVEPTEHELLVALYEFNQVVLHAYEQYKPSLLCTHLFHIAKSFSRFYANASVLNAPDEEIRGARMALVAATAGTLGQGLKLLGITPPVQM